MVVWTVSTALENFKVCLVSEVHGLDAWYDPFYSLLATFATPASFSYSMPVYWRTRIWLNMQPIKYMVCTKTWRIWSKFWRRPSGWPPSDVLQQMPLEPAVFYGQDLVIQEITQLLIKEDTCRVCILGASGMNRLQFHWALSNSLSSRHGFFQKTLSEFLAFEAASADHPLEILCSSLGGLAVTAATLG